jgi:hypothetical protein
MTGGPGESSKQDTGMSMLSGKGISLHTETVADSPTALSMASTPGHIVLQEHETAAAFGRHGERS